MTSFLENILHLNFIEPIGKRIILVPEFTPRPVSNTKRKPLLS